MLRSMYSGISGMKGFQNKLDVIGNNIANVNTTGFKKGRVTFQDMMSQTSQGASAPANGRGGVNPKQVGTGTQIGSIDNLHTQGFRQTTNHGLDLMLEGDGMFAVENPNGDGYLYTRAGNFSLDRDGRLVTSDGNYVAGFQSAGGTGININSVDSISIPRQNTNDSATSIDIKKDGTVTYINQDKEQIIAGQIAIGQFSNPGGLTKVGGNLFEDSDNAGFSANPGSITGLYSPEQGGAASIVSGAIEMANVDLSEEFTEMITAQRGFQANTRIITTSDEILQELVNLKR